MKQEEWSRFVLEALCNDDENESNVRLPFSKLTKKYGRAYLEYCRAAWKANDGCLTEEEFMAINGGMPRPFFEKVIKKMIK